ncbi:MAG TPA: phospholipase D-like domain-containing protein [Burkholderiales bacterium]|nr:phospholipase D-like domain-containing protein [Burkholderiales bacterium]
MRLGKKAWVAAVSIAATTVVVLLMLNLSLGDKQIDRRLEHRYDVADPQFPRTMGVLLGPPLLDGNQADELVNGEEIFPAMLGAIRSARHTITFETYIYWSGRIGGQFADVLAERARAGVKVHVLLDWVGSGKIDPAYMQTMEQAGVQVRRYNKPRWYSLGRLNNRTHRKLLVVDGAVGFTGGVGIADVWLGDAQSPEQWRDTHFRLRGPAVGQLQAAFMDNWTQATGEVLHGAEYFPPLPPQGEHYAQVFLSSPGGGAESMQLMYLLSITAASKSIRLSMSYFVPDDVAINTFVAALERGVKVQIITPGGHIDTEIVRKASRASWGKLLEAGAEIYEYQPTMFHCKVMVVDDLWVSVGSTNFDNRSFAVNDEANLNVLDARFAARQVEIFEQDLSRSKRITLQEWKRRPWREKLLEHTAGLLGSQL